MNALAYNPKLVRDAVKKHIGEIFPSWDSSRIISSGVPTSETLVRDSAGNIRPYIITLNYRPIRQGTRSFAGPRWSEYLYRFDVLSVAATADGAEVVADRLENGLIGFQLPNIESSVLDATAGYGTFVVQNANGVIEAFYATSSFQLMIGKLDSDETVGETSAGTAG